MLITFFVLKLTLDAIVDECNRLALAEEKKTHVNLLKSRLFQIQTDYESGLIDKTSYNEKEADILKEIYELGGKPKPNNSMEMDS